MHDIYCTHITIHSKNWANTTIFSTCHNHTHVSIVKGPAQTHNASSLSLHHSFETIPRGQKTSEPDVIHAQLFQSSHWERDCPHTCWQGTGGRETHMRILSTFFYFATVVMSSLWDCHGFYKTWCGNASEDGAGVAFLFLREEHLIHFCHWNTHLNCISGMLFLFSKICQNSLKMLHKQNESVKYMLLMNQSFMRTNWHLWTLSYAYVHGLKRLMEKVEPLVQPKLSTGTAANQKIVLVTIATSNHSQMCVIKFVSASVSFFPFSSFCLSLAVM